MKISTLLAAAVAGKAVAIPATRATGTQFAGVNIAGFDFGVLIDGTQDISNAQAPNANQMAHFATDDGSNIFRLPAGWQFLTNNQGGGNLDDTNFGKYDALVQACLATGAHCILDLHNYARWNGQIVGQGGPADDDLVSFWTGLAMKYANEDRIVFGIMNEPHDLPSITTWAATVQKVVTAIRNAGATSQLILLPGDNFTSAADFVNNGSLDALVTVTNPDGTTTGLIFDVHKYLDSDNSGTHTDCVSNSIDNAFAPLADALRAVSRQAILSETGGGNTDSCLQDVCEQNDYLNQNSDVYLGYVGWAAGAFDDTYELTLTPTQNGGSWTDKPLMKCFAR
ncbi:hypothetical protein V495_02176 [Pseudogymnoascus sp. VKM F-4514 (FW-929)]|nr:hypothetical protein V490_01101 [Pseudogymnoascus sp. VKM F-3557]KFY46908.1 hypothetical protein V495_02176 [Pseudogymnoascus sp. VKM F-4514 (FW-929)]KFY64576.1 hypothetical protein V497_01671 [Pseudogymnoascus sp. VKM F-4516 (FW-969)]